MPRTRKHPRTKKTGVKKDIWRKRPIIHVGVIPLALSHFVPRKSVNIRFNLGFFIQHSGLLFILVGALLVVAPRAHSLFPNHLNNQGNESENAIIPDSDFKNTTTQKQLPIHIVIPAVKVDLPVKEAKLIKGVWETSESTASYGEGSAVPNEKGNTVIFAHAREKLFLPLKDIKLHDVIYVFTQNNWYTYEVDEIKEVKPKDTYVIKSTEDKRLTLFTCSGFLDSRRLVVVAKPL